jgi:hypothetical protein
MMRHTLGLLHGYHASATSSSSDSSNTPPEEPAQQQDLAQEQQRGRLQDQEQQSEGPAEGQWLADLVSDCMESCIIRDNYELLESLVTLPPAGLIGELRCAASCCSVESASLCLRILTYLLTWLGYNPNTPPLNG